jgi:hypothetical protein
MSLEPMMFVTMFVLYIAIAMFILFITRGASRRQRRLIVAFLILLPSWDFVLGTAIYYSAWPFLPKEAIYETVETEGIYYEGGYSSNLLLVDSRYFGEVRKTWITPLLKSDFKEGYQYVEALITSKQNSDVSDRKEIVSPPAIYRCTPLPRDPSNPNHIYTQCDPVEHARSGYLVKVSKFELTSFEMNSLKIFNRTTGKLMAEYREIIRWNYLPFFVWLFRHQIQLNAEGDSCPDKSRLYDFQFDVLKVKKQRGADT